MKILSLFSGIGAFEKALDNLGIPYELEAYCEIDKYASKAYAAIHGVPEAKNLGDITKVDETKVPKDLDLVTYGFPCQDISVAGNLKGMFNEDGTQTRSGLFFEALRIIETAQPKIAIAENVKNLTSKRFAEQFRIVLNSLEQAGYNNYWHILNAKDFGIPQNRERVFIVSIRKDIDNGTFQFPEGFPLELRLKDVLEEVVDEKYYLPDKMKEYLFTVSEKNKMRNNGNVYKPCDVDGISKTITTQEGSRVKDNFIEDSSRVISVCNVNPCGRGMNGNVIDEEGLSSTLTTNKGEGLKILVREATRRGYAEAYEGDSINLEQPNSKTRRGRVGKQIAQTLNTTCHLQAVAVASRGRLDDCGKWQQQFEISDREYANSITTAQKDSLIAEPNVLRQERSEYGKQIRKAYDSGAVSENWAAMKKWVPRTDGITNTLSTVQKDNLLHDGCLRIRKLTPKECFRLMGFDDSDFEKAEAVVSNTQLYKQAGNSIVVPVVEHIFKALVASGIEFNRRSENNVGKNTLEESCV